MKKRTVFIASSIGSWLLQEWTMLRLKRWNQVLKNNKSWFFRLFRNPLKPLIKLWRRAVRLCDRTNWSHSFGSIVLFFRNLHLWRFGLIFRMYLSINKFNLVLKDAATKKSRNRAFTRTKLTTCCSKYPSVLMIKFLIYWWTQTFSRLSIWTSNLGVLIQFFHVWLCRNNFPWPTNWLASCNRTKECRFWENFALFCTMHSVLNFSNGCVETNF